jgi:hypothetical protein
MKAGVGSKEPTDTYGIGGWHRHQPANYRFGGGLAGLQDVHSRPEPAGIAPAV